MLIRKHFNELEELSGMVVMTACFVSSFTPCKNVQMKSGPLIFTKQGSYWVEQGHQLLNQSQEEEFVFHLEPPVTFIFNCFASAL